jgi:hypothetical protein
VLSLLMAAAAVAGLSAVRLDPTLLGESEQRSNVA